MSADDDKQRAAAAALDFVEPGMKLGLGTGSTARRFVDLLGAKVAAGLKIIGVPTSQATHTQAERLGIPLATLEEEPQLDLTIDGADEIDPRLQLIKGGGGALLREKIVAASSKRMIVVADETKLVGRLGKFPLAVEVLEFGHASTATRIAEALAALGYKNAPVTLRTRDGTFFRSDNGNPIYDCALGAIDDAPRLATALDSIPGIAEHGLFVGIAHTLLIARPGGVEVIERA